MRSKVKNWKKRKAPTRRNNALSLLNYLNSAFKICDWKYFYIFVVCFLITLSATGYVDAHEKNFQVDPDSQELCKWYASRNHEKEFAPERWAIFKDWIVKYDWYDSCLGHIKYPVIK